MFGLAILLVAGTTLANAIPAHPPPYVQSREAFTYVRTLVSEYLAPQNGDINDAETRQHFSFGILAGITAGMVMANKTSPSYHPLIVVNENMPYAWRNYKQISQRGQALLNEASAKINLMEDLINNLCDADGVDQCNRKIETKVRINPEAYRRPAELLLLLGNAADSIRQLEPTIESVTKERTEIPFLINSADTQDIRSLVDELDNAYRKMKELHFRRFSEEIL